MSILIGLGLADAPEARVDLKALEAGSSTLAAAQMDDVLGLILKTVYEAYAEAEEEAIYDGLARVVAGDLITELYLQQRRSVAYGLLAGVETEVLGIELMARDARAAGAGYLVDASWRVVGRLDHETHSHERVNLYQADLRIAPVAGQWRLTGFELGEIVREPIDEFVGGE